MPTGRSAQPARDVSPIIRGPSAHGGSCRLSGDVEERRGARVGTVSGLALLAGGTAVAGVAGGAHSIFATILLGLLALVMGHALLVEIRRQARRRSPRWARQDTINAVLLGCWAE